MTATESPRLSPSDTPDRIGSGPLGVLYSFDRFSTTSTLFDPGLFERSLRTFRSGDGLGRRFRAPALRQLRVDFEGAVGHLRDRVVPAHVRVGVRAQVRGECRVLFDAAQP